MSFDEDACYDTDLDIPSGRYGKLLAIPTPGATGPPGPAGPAGPPGQPGDNGDGYAPLGPDGVVPPEYLPPIPDGVEFTANKAVAGGYAPLDGGSKVPAAHLPSYVDDVLEFATQSVFPQPGTSGVIYVDLSTGGTFRWSGTAYIAISDKVTADGITDSGTAGRAVVRSETPEEARDAIGAVSDTEVADEVAKQIADDNTVEQAAVEAIRDEIKNRRFVEWLPIQDDIAMAESDQDGVTSRYVDLEGRTWIKPHPDLLVHQSNMGMDIPVPRVVETDGSLVFGITDEDDRCAIAIYSDATVSFKPSHTTLSRFRVAAEPSWSTKVGGWNPEKALYNYHPTGLTHWFAALARAMAGTGTAHITTFLDSETYGLQAVRPKWLNSWPGRVRRQLNTLTGNAGGTGMAVPWNQLVDQPLDDPRWVFGAGAAQLAGAGSATLPNYGVLGRGAIRLTNSSGTGFVEFTPADTTITQFTIYAMADSGATGLATVKVDGTNKGTFDVSAAGGAGTLPRRAGTPTNVIVVDVTGLTAGTHTVRVEGPAASTVTIWAVEGGTGKGVRVSNFGRGGCNAAHLALTDTNNLCGLGLHADTAKADLSILMLGLNDRTNTADVYKASVTSALDRIKAAGGDVLLVNPGQPNYGAAGIGTSSLIPRSEDLYKMADLYNAPLLDLGWVRKDFASANALGLYGDDIHSNDTGLEHHARFIFNTLTGA